MNGSPEDLIRSVSIQRALHNMQAAAPYVADLVKVAQAASDIADVSVSVERPAVGGAKGRLEVTDLRTGATRAAEFTTV